MNNATQCFGTLLDYMLVSQHKDHGADAMPEVGAGKAVRNFIRALQGELPQGDEESPYDEFLRAASLAVHAELAQANEETVREFAHMVRLLEAKPPKQVLQTPEFMQHLWRVFSHEACALGLDELLNANDMEQAAQPLINTLRERRTVRIRTLNPHPIKDAVREVLFTSNVLLTLPKEQDIASLPISEASKEALHHIIKNEPQKYWYDHPIPLGVAREADELIYGLRGLEHALKFEKHRGSAAADATLSVVLSVSVTHPSLGAIAREYLQAHIAQEHFEGLAVYVFTEEDALNIASNFEEHAKDFQGIVEVLGVDGRYGRHYSFLKAISAIWHVCVDDGVRATFKIDLDQVFPQEVLVKETGKSAFEHLQSPLWGSDAVDADGVAVHLGMVAGALVNEADIHKGLFTPDVHFPRSGEISAEDLFFPRLPLMAVSTRAEMMMRYPEADNATCLQRVHVTGGTNGILVDALRAYRPFTPSFIGRAEDQAYILSVHGSADISRLRYVHASGLLMRHDKAAFASEAIKAAKHGTFVGDLLRTLLFSHYAKALPGGLAYAKYEFAPFTSCFISDMPTCFVMGRLILSLGRLLTQGNAEDAEMQLELAARELKHVLGLEGEQNIAKQYEYERKAWNGFYDALNRMEHDEAYAVQRERIKSHIKASRIL